MSTMPPVEVQRKEVPPLPPTTTPASFTASAKAPAPFRPPRSSIPPARVQLNEWSGYTSGMTLARPMICPVALMSRVKRWPPPRSPMSTSPWASFQE